MIAIIDYGMGNIHSVKKALEYVGAKTVVTHSPAELKKATKIVLPGVGAFGDAMEELKTRDLISPIQEAVRHKKIFLGICLGMQLLFEKSQESGQAKGLGILKGVVKKFPDTPDLKVPHMGWNQLRKVTSPKSHVAGECPLLKEIPDNAFVYFCHSYYPAPKEKSIAAAVTEYGSDFASVVWEGNVFGVQFHPEKSQSVGLRMIKNFVEMA